MKKLVCILAVLLCLGALVIPASARSNAEQLRCEAKVGKDGSCDVTITASVVFDETVSDPVFPIPMEAANVTLNGSAVDTSKDQTSKLISLNRVTGGAAGVYNITITYRLENAVTAQKDGATQLKLPILCGFAYPVDLLTVTVSLPGEATEQPTFESAYYQEYTDQLLKTRVAGKTVTVEAQQRLLDYETLTMTLPVDESMFPGTSAAARMLGMADWAAGIVIVLAVVYFALTMMPALPRKVLRSGAPDGITAGDVPRWLIGGATDLSMLVVSWAQLGYLRMESLPDGRVMLHKRMEMGNERSNFENRCFKSLFGRRNTVDATGEHYARMVLSTEKKTRRNRDVYEKKSGNPYIFRAMCALAALLSGVSLAGGFWPNALALRLLVAVVIAVLAWLTQNAVKGISLRRRLPLWIAMGAAAVWMLLGLLAGQWLFATLMILVQLLAGFAAAYGGKRTDLGRQASSQLFGLRKFLCTAPRKDLLRLMKANPGYFHEVAPYAMAMGVDRLVAVRFGKLRISECPYLSVGDKKQMTAARWMAELRKTVQTMDAKARKTLPWQK